jgi:hypothetical protein
MSYTSHFVSTRSSMKSFKYSVDDVWAAACAAQRVNGSYVKEPVRVLDKDTGEVVDTKPRSRDVMMDFLALPGTITDEDRATGRECRRYLQNDLTFRALKGRLTDFDSTVSRAIAVEDEFDSVKHRLELAVLACLPQSHQRSLARAGTDDRLARCNTIDADVGNKVMLDDVEVVRTSYSQKWGIHWITAVTADNRAVVFSFKQSFDTGTHLTIRGTVKAQRDGKTQLNRVKVL